MKSSLSRAPLLLTLAAACMAVLTPAAHATITVSTWANCAGGNGSPNAKMNYSYTYQSPMLAEWSFGLAQQEITNYGTFVGGYGVSNAQGYVWQRYDFDTPLVMYQAMGMHFGYDGHASYTVYTSASTCDPSKYNTYQEPPKASAATALAATTAATPAAIEGAGAAAPRGVRIDSAANVMPLAQLQQQQRTWQLVAPRTAADSVAALLADAKHPSFERALAVNRERLTFTAAQTGSTELAKLTPAKSLPAGNASEAGWSGYTRVYRTGTDEWVLLEELDLQALQASAVILRESINADVNGSPALLRTASADGANLTALTWIAGGKRYSLKTNAAPAKAGDRLLAIARGLY